MDFGLYNKHPVQAGRHGTLIGNWFEEVSLPTPLDTTRPRFINTFERVVAHYDNRDSTPKLSQYQTDYIYDKEVIAKQREESRYPNQRQEMLARLKQEEAEGKRVKYQTSYQCSIELTAARMMNQTPPSWAQKTAASSTISDATKTIASQQAQVQSLRE